MHTISACFVDATLGVILGSIQLKAGTMQHTAGTWSTSSWLMMPQAISQSNEGEVDLPRQLHYCLLVSNPQCGASLKAYTETEQMATPNRRCRHKDTAHWVVCCLVIRGILNKPLFNSSLQLSMRIRSWQFHIFKNILWSFVSL